MSRRSWLPLVILVAHALAPLTAAGAGRTTDRLDRFRDLAVSRLAPVQLGTTTRSTEDDHEILAVLDEEVVQNLASGGLFATPGFLQDRLDGFADTWGGAAFRVLRVGALIVVAVSFGESGANSVRVYGPLGDEPALLATLVREGRPSLYTVSGGPSASPQFLVAWEGASSGRGTRNLRLDLARLRGADLTVAWSTAELFPDGLLARSYRVARNEIAIRYELHYPGWIPGCEGQTEQEDVYRFTPDHRTLTRASRRQFNDWHVTLHESVGRILAALAKGDRGALAALVPDTRVRNALPERLERDAACDAREGGGPVSVAAVADAHRPWSLTFLRSGTQWRLTAASPVLP